MSTNPDRKHRLVTRADFDGLVCAVLFKELNLIDEIKFAHPKDIQDRKVEITGRDITTNLPFDDRCFLAFDHHVSEMLKHGGKVPQNLILDPEAASAARVVYRYYGGHKQFKNISERMIVAVDKADAARFTKQEVLDPSGWVLLNFIMDPRTGLGRFSDFRVSNWELLMRLIDYCRQHTVDEILALPDVRERVDLYFDHKDRAVEQLRRCSKVYDSVVVLDLRDETTIYACNRFMIYALYPDCNASIHVFWGQGARTTVFAVGHSIFNRTCPINVGELCLRYSGGGHTGAGTIQLPHSEAEQVLEELIQQLNPVDEEDEEEDGEVYDVDDVPIVLAAVDSDDDSESGLAENEPVAAEDDLDEETLEEFGQNRHWNHDVPPRAEGSDDEVEIRSRERDEEQDCEIVSLDADQTEAESLLEQTLAETGMPLVATKEDIRRIHARLDTVERKIAELQSTRSKG